MDIILLILAGGILFFGIVNLFFANFLIFFLAVFTSFILFTLMKILMNQHEIKVQISKVYEIVYNLKEKQEKD